MFILLEGTFDEVTIKLYKSTLPAGCKNVYY